MEATKEPEHKEVLDIRKPRESDDSETEETTSKCKPVKKIKSKKSQQQKTKLIAVDNIPPYHTKPIAEIFDEFNVTADEGIASNDEARLIQKYGKNELRGDSGVS